MRFLSVLKTRAGSPINFAKLEEPIAELCQKYRISLFYVFGAYALGNAHKLSDLDIAYLSEKRLNLDIELKLIGDLEKIFEEEAIDLVNLKYAPLTLIHRILKEGKCLFAPNLKKRIEFETNKESLYFDTRYIREEYFAALEERIANGAFGYR